MAEKKDILKGKKIDEEMLEQVSGGACQGGSDLVDKNLDCVSVRDRQIKISTEYEQQSNSHMKIKSGGL